MGLEVGALPADVGVLERPGQAAQQLMLGDLDAGMRAMFTPQTLTVKERNAFLKKHGLDTGPWGRLFRAVTNPVLLLSLALCYKFPVPSAENIFKVGNAIKGMTRRFPILGRLSSMQGLYRGTEVPGIFGTIIRDVRDFQSKYDGATVTALNRFKARAGRNITQREQLMAAAWLDGLHKPLRGFQGTRGVITIGKGESRRVIPAVGALLPNLERQMSPALRQFAGDTRVILNDMWETSFGSVKNREQLARVIRGLEQKGWADELSISMREFIEHPKKLKDYFPHRLLQSEEDFRQLMYAMTDAAGLKAFARSAERKTMRWLGPEVHKREFGMLPSIQDLKGLGDLVDRQQIIRLEEVVKAKVLTAARTEGNLSLQTLRKLDKYDLATIQEHYPKLMSRGEAEEFALIFANAKPRPYSLKLLPVLSSYRHTLSHTYSWTIKGGGEKITEQLHMLKTLGREDVPGSAYAKMRAQMLEDTYIPMALGRGTMQGAMKAQAWDQGMHQLAAWTQTPKVRKVLGESLSKTMAQQMVTNRGAFSYINMSQRAAGWFYLSTLGMNPASALKNMLQLVLTTGPVVGYKTAAAGLQEALRKSHKYFAARLGPRKLSHDGAIRFAWPEYGKSGVAAAPITDVVLLNSFENAYNIAALPTGKLKNVGQKISAAMMAIFTASETAVRLSSWEAGIIHAKRSRMPVEAAHKFAARLVEETQFLTGPQNTPYALVDKNPLVRQLMQFPLRMLEFATHTAFNLGVTDIDPITRKARNILGKNPGTFARMVAGSVLAMELGDASGIDMRSALLGGAMPTFQEGREGAFGGFPLIPPAFQLAGSAAYGVATGDFGEAMRSTPLLIPGGISMFRSMGFLPGEAGVLGQRAAKLFERTYADYEQPAPDGRIAVYSGKGALKGFFTQWELIRMGLGVRAGDQATEQELMTMLTRNRDAIRESRRDYLEARLKNDADAAQSIAERFVRQFGFPLPVTEQHIEAMQVRRRTTRLEQMVRTMPPGPARDQFIQLIATELGASAPALLGIEPGLLGEPSPVREAARQPRPESPLGRRPYQTGPFDTVNPQTIGRQPTPRTGRFGF